MARRPAQRGQAPRRSAPKGATTRRRPSSSGSGERRGMPGWLWGVIGLVAGFALSQYLQQSAPAPVATVVPKPASQVSSSDSGAPADEPETDASQASRMPTFEFYTLLPESEVIAPKVEAYHSTPRPPEKAASTPSNGQPASQASSPASGRYMLQAASFKASDDAERLASRLRDFGLLAKITSVRTSDDQLWHRVQVGPYQDTRELSRAQDLMVTQGIEPLLIKLQE
ncbi:SPOR domain-containing protein [Halomonas sp. WWR20]